MSNWKGVVGYEGIYEVSDKGEVRTHKNKTTYTKKHGVRKWKQRTLKQKVSKDNNCRVTLWKDGKETTFLVHRLVAMAFIPKIEGKECVNHKDGSRLNNHIENLEWCNHKENSNHAFDNGLMATNKAIILKDKKTSDRHYFRSMQKASFFLDKKHGYISDLLKRGKKETEDFFVEEA